MEEFKNMTAYQRKEVSALPFFEALMSVISNNWLRVVRAIRLQL